MVILKNLFDWLREKGIAKAAKKADRIAAEGLTAFVVDGDTAAIVEVNSETDFVMRWKLFSITTTSRQQVRTTKAMRFN